MTDKVANLPPLRDIIRDHELRATKALGQNFLLDLNLTRKIARQADIQSYDTLIEIGPGPGGLTRGLLLEGAQSVTAIEFDERAVKALQSLVEAADGTLSLIHGDALAIDTLDFGADGTRKIVANLPYNIATPLIINWLKQIHDQGNDAYQSLTLMVQKEVADRITAKVSTKQYGRLSILCQWLCHSIQAFDVPASAFVPPPKVTSTIIHLTPRPRNDTVAFNAIEKLTAAAFGQRRKTIRQSIKPFKDALGATDIEQSLRAENLSIDDFLSIASKI
ncbi:MAG: 16S rRNA (adenine(1518)-N(6)/adenine(1519)-N(6))-dimethyltransferase [Alphaproteobacteria bacterium]|nr:MAG: 16S rRNA (adenine(1518)-N(6)/adenine(1519)-N(6))-dimethyltransferase [Alphaproteobacteria bacterium]